MAFPVAISKYGGTNQRVLRALKSGRIPYTMGMVYHWMLRLKVGDWTGEADGSQTFDLNTLATTLKRPTFPADVEILDGTKCYLVTAFAGGTVNACTVTLGDAGAANGLLTSTSVFTGQALGWKQTTAATEFRQHYEAAFVPQIVLATTNGNTNALTAGELWVDIPFTKSPVVA